MIILEKSLDAFMNQNKEKDLKYELLNKCFKNSESLLNEIWQIAYSLYRSKEITKIVYNDIIKSIKV